MISLLGLPAFLSFLQPIVDFFSLFGDFMFNLLILLLFIPLYFVFMGISTVSLFAETAFKKLAGIDTIYLNGEGYGGGMGNGQDLVYAFIQDPTVQNVFWAIVALSILLLFILTIVALIKSEFALDLKGSAKGPIIGRAFKSLANFIVVPAATLISIIAVNYITTSLYDLFGNQNSTIVTKSFALGGYNANRARRDSDFAAYLRSGEYLANSSSANPYSGGDLQIAATIDSQFVDFSDDTLSVKSFDLHDAAEAKRNNKYYPTQTWFIGVGSDSGFTIWQIGKVNFFYNLFYFDYILGLGSALVMAWTLLTVCLVLVKRVFEMTILFLLAPPMTAIAPLDGGQAEKKWRQEFMKRLLAVMGPIFAYNMFFLMIPLFENISLFGGSVKLATGATYGGSSAMLSSLQTSIIGFSFVFDMFFQIVCILTGLSVVKSASALFSNLLGVDDLIKSGSENAKKAVDLGKKGFGLATAVGGVALKGVAAAARMGKGAMKGLGNKAGRLQKREDKAKEKLEQAKADAEAKGTLGQGGAADDKISKLEEKYEEAKQKNFDYNTGKTMDAGKKAVVKFNEDKEKVKKKLDEEEKNTNYVKGSEGEKQHKDRLAALRKEYEEKYGGADEQKTEDIKEKLIGDTISKRQEKINSKKKGPTGIWSGIKAGYDLEYGVDSGSTNLLGSLAGKVDKSLNGGGGKFGKFMGGIPILGTRLKKHSKAFGEYFNVSGETATRRLNDMIAGIGGENGFGDLWKINFNGNARAGLFEGVPEAKAREQNIQQNLLMGARKKYEDKEEAKKLEENQLKEMARYFAEENNDPKYRKLMEDRGKAEKAGNDLEVKKIDAKISQFNIDSGYLAQARSALKDKSFFGSQGYQDFRERIKKQANEDAKTKELEAKEYIEKSAGNNSDKPQAVKKDSSDREKDKKDMVEAFKEALKGGVEFKAESIDEIKKAVASGGTSIAAEIQKALTEALEALKH